jgi:chromosome segregation ATPase
MNDDLSDLPGPVRAELTRLRAERVVFVSEREKLLGQLQEADTSARELMADRDRLAAQLGELPETVRNAEEQAGELAALRAELAVARTERDALRNELAGTRAERDALRLRLLDAEVVLSGREPSSPAAPVASSSGADRVAAAEARAAHLARELAATRATVSWRVTAPLRAVRRKSR